MATPYITKITSSDFENPLEVLQTDGTISIPKEVILRDLCQVDRHPRTLLALNYHFVAVSHGGV